MKKYKNCGLESDHAQEGTLQSATQQAVLPDWIINSRQKFSQFEKYACQVFDLPKLLKHFADNRRDPRIGTFDVANSLFHTAVFRIPSINALEGDLKEADFQKLIGRCPRQDVKAFSAEVVSNVLDKLELSRLSDSIERVFWSAERNKAFREETYGGLRCAAIDGWEPFNSFDRHCPDCLEREVKFKKKGGEEIIRIRYYHRYVVAVLVGPLPDIVLHIEPVRNKAARVRAGENNAVSDEGEMTAALRLIDRIHKTYGTFIDAMIFDSLYPNGPVLSRLTDCRYDAFIIMKLRKTTSH